MGFLVFYIHVGFFVFGFMWLFLEMTKPQKMANLTVWWAVAFWILWPLVVIVKITETLRSRAKGDRVQGKDTGQQHGK